MSDELLPYYDRELAFVRRLGAEFAEAHPKIAGRLRLSADTAEDPHVERLIEAFAYLNARLRHKLDDDFPELSDAMLSVLYPHYLAPIPSLAIVQFVLDRSQGELTAGYGIPQETVLETEPIDGHPCRFRTCYPVTLWPVELREARLAARPFAAPVTPFSASAAAVLRIQLQCLSNDVTFAALTMDRLRCYLKGQSQHVYALYELLFNNVVGIALAASPQDPQPVLLGPESIEPVGFERDQGLLPYTPRTFVGYRLLTEYFSFPEKFLFFDLAGLGNGALARAAPAENVRGAPDRGPPTRCAVPGQGSTHSGDRMPARRRGTVRQGRPAAVRWLPKSRGPDRSADLVSRHRPTAASCCRNSPE
jgi:type VI secretion system protein ImpG